MKILIITQKYDLNDANLGAFNVWWEKLAEKLDFVYILALEKRSEPPRSNMKVFSMGKERGLEKIGRLFNFYKNLFKILPKTGAVFIHMIPLYLILAWLPAKLFRNRLVMWYAGVTMNNLVRFAVWLSDKALTSHEGALRTKSKKRVIVGHGIDTELFKISNLKSQISTVNILSIGRITPSKGHDLIIETVAALIKEGYNLKLEIIGGVVQEYHREYQKSLKKLAAALNITDKVEFTGAINYHEMPRYYNDADILIDAVPSGGFDKVILEAMASGVIPLTSNEYLKSVFPEEISADLVFKERKQEDLKMKLKSIIDKELYKNEALSRQMREIVVKNYNLDGFIDQILNLLYELAR